MTGPLRAAGYRARAADAAGRPARVAPLPMLLSLAYLLSVFTFFTEYASPFAQTLAARAAGSTSYRIEELALASILLQSALLTGVVLLALRRWRLPFGSLVLILGLNTTLIVLMHKGFQSTGPAPLIAAAVLAGLAGDALGLWLRPSVDRSTAFRAYAIAVPVLLYACYFAVIQAFGGGIAWRIHMWSGAIVLAGVAGWLLSYAYLPPASLE